MVAIYGPSHFMCVIKRNTLNKCTCTVYPCVGDALGLAQALQYLIKTNTIWLWHTWTHSNRTG